MEKAAEGDQLWRLTLQHSPVGMSLVSPEGRLVAVNDSFCQMVGYDAPTLRSMTFQQITHPDDLEDDLLLLQETLEGVRTSYRLVKRYVHADGHPVWVDLSVALLREEGGAPIHFIAQILDISEQYEYRRRLAVAHATIDHQRRMAEAVYDTTDVGLVLIDRHGHYERMNRRHRDFMALAFPAGHAGQAGQVGEVYGEDATTPLTTEQMPSYRAVGGEEFDDLRIWIGADPLTRRALSVSARTVRDPSGEFAGAALAYKDVTDYLRALEVKDEFVASVSHELRTPLTAVLGHLELLAEDPTLPAHTRTRLQVVERNALRLRQLVSDLLHVASGRDGGIQIVRTRTDLAAVVAEAVDAALPAATAAELTVETDLPDQLEVMVDSSRMRQVVDNLLSNAVKYSESGGTVNVTLAQTGSDVGLTVQDTGLGISPTDLERLFTRFFRGEAARERHIPGTGLGLNIVRSIVEAHGGTVSLVSEQKVGSTVRIRLGLSQPLGPQR